MFSDVLKRKHWGRGCLPISPWEGPGGVEGVWGWVLGVFHYFFFELDAEMSLPHAPSWPLCSLSLFSSHPPCVSQLLPSPPPCPPCWQFPFPACAGLWEAPSQPTEVPLGYFYPPQSSSFPHSREGRSCWHLLDHGAAPSPLAGIHLDGSCAGDLQI